ncbi:MAG: hypothetical protein QOI98_2209, partial [Solirubrobacteraceae bacterium]|nr:hypothetical protein [Solirubrobacteraceae bacterium]
MTPTIQVAVCVSSREPALDDCLRALAGQIASPLVVVAGMDDDAAGALEVDVHALVPGATVLREPLPGQAQARNRALAASDADVIAFVDPDVAVAETWLRSLEDAWAQARDDVGCVGGPIGVRFPSGRPPWLTDPLLGAFGALDYGEHRLDLDAAQRTLMGGNLSFRAAALRGVGGFWPARGREGARDWFSEEHHAQRELAGVGWRCVYEPGVEASRVVSPPRPRA